MASPADKKLTAARERPALDATAVPAGSGGGAPDLQRRDAAAALRRRFAAQRERPAVSAALASARAFADRAFSRQGTREKLKGLKDEFRGLQSLLGLAVSLQLRSEARRNASTGSIADATGRNEQFSNEVAELRDKRDKRAAVISEQLQALELLETKSNEDAALREKIEEAILWYEKFLGFQVVAGQEGVNFVFNKIDLQIPEKEYSFCLNFGRGRNNPLVRCDPYIKDVEELVKDVHLGDNLAKFVRIAREKFQSSAITGTLPASPAVDPDVSAAPPLPSLMLTSANRTSEDVPIQSQSQIKNKGQALPAKRGATALSAASPASLRRSPRNGGELVPGADSELDLVEPWA
ncbi:hypothetical protein U9M48_041534 [Paspalum notatum var. saurae]|uniref:Kinetochore protein SPC25 n=1 Tax=Paspalum notatum var. saurae TaxID=547442 RepID=A0AAQ3UP96_PASNO